MSMLEIHSEALDGGNIVFHEFLLRFKLNSQVVFGIVEGKEDPMFYRGLIERHLPRGWDVELLKSGNRSNVLNAINGFDWMKYPRNRICFFVDRDLTLFHKKEDPVAENLYITQLYSIENDAVNFNTAMRILTEVLNLTELEMEDISKINEKFDKNLTFFQNSLAPVMAQIIAWQSAQHRPSLDNISMKDLFYFDQGILYCKAGYETAEEKINYAANKTNMICSSKEILTLNEKIFSSLSGPTKFTRGKYMLWFLVEFCIHFHQIAAVFCKKYTAPPKVRITMGHTNAMVLIGPRVRAPESLSIFLKNNYENYIKSLSPENYELSKIKNILYFRKIFGNIFKGFSHKNKLNRN